MKLKEFANITMGQSPKGETYNNINKGTPFMQGRKNFCRMYPSIDTWTTNPLKIAESNSILLSVRAPVGDMNIIKDEICIGRGLCSIIAKNRNNLYLYYNLLYNVDRLKAKSNGTVFDSVNKNDLENLEIYIHSEIEQKKIERILFDIDEKIELNNDINNNLYEIASKLYEEKFVNCRNEEWDSYSLIDIANIVNGYSYKGTELVDESSMGMATIKNFDRNGGFKEDGFKPLNPNKVKDSQYIEKFDVVVACTDLTQNADIIGNAILLLSKEKYEKIIISMDLVKIIPTSDLVDNFMIYSILNSQEFKNFALGYTSGTTVLHLNKNCFKDYIIKLPSKKKIENYIKTIKPIYTKISQTMEENKVLEKLRDTLLPKLMNGEIDLENIEI